MSWSDALTGFLGGGRGGGASAPSSTTVHNHIQFTNAASASQGGVHVGVGQEQGGASSDVRSDNQAGARSDNRNDVRAASQSAAAADSSSSSSSSSGPSSTPAPSSGGSAGAALGGPPPSAAGSGQAPSPTGRTADAQAQMDLLGRAIEKLIERCAQLQQRAVQLEDLAPPVGSILAWHKSAHNGALIPDGWLDCNGQTKVIGNRTYTTPNLNSGGKGGVGLFIKGGTTSGIHQESAIQKHKHTIAAYRASVTDAQGAVMERSQMYFAPPGAVDTHRVSFKAGPHGFQGDMGVTIPAHSSDETGGDETRPENMSMVWIMRVF